MFFVPTNHRLDEDYFEFFTWTRSFYYLVTTTEPQGQALFRSLAKDQQLNFKFISRQTSNKKMYLEFQIFDNFTDNCWISSTSQRRLQFTKQRLRALTLLFYSILGESRNANKHQTKSTVDCWLTIADLSDTKQHYFAEFKHWTPPNVRFENCAPCSTL